MKLQSVDGGTAEVQDEIANATFNEPLVHELIVAYLSGSRVGDKGQKTRSEVSGGGKKPWRQKGTGRARSGTIRSPIWVGGGRAFATRPGQRNFQKKVNRKAYSQAMKGIVAELIRQERFLTVSKISQDTVSTKEFKKQLQGWGVEKGLIICTEVDRNVYLSSRNLPAVEVLDVGAVNPLSLIQAEKVLCSEEALNSLQQRLMKK
jgi:large subunit ribosomal protein L4